MKLKTIFLSIILFTFISSCSSDEAGQIIDNTPTTFEIIAESPNHNTLEDILISTELKDILDSGVYTVFAPTDDAFAAIDLSVLTDEQLKQTLLNHVLNGKAESSDLSNGYEKSNATENFTGNNNFVNLYISVDGGLILNGISSVTNADRDASNGVVHFVDAVLTIPDITTFVAADANFSTLFTALTRDDQPNFVDILSDFEGQAPFTVFAPTNQAFVDVLAELELESLEDIETATLTSTLNTHVLAEEISREENFDTGTLNTLGGNINLDAATNTITDQNERNINIIITNIQTGNGVIHTIDKVILP